MLSVLSLTLHRQADRAVDVSNPQVAIFTASTALYAVGDPNSGRPRVCQVQVLQSHLSTPVELLGTCMNVLDIVRQYSAHSWFVEHVHQRSSEIISGLDDF